MKKFLIAVFSALLIITMALFCFAEEEALTEEPAQTDEVTEEFSVKEYITEKIAPIAVGVATSLIAFIGAFQKIKSTVSSLNSSSSAIKELKDVASDTLSGIKEELDKGIKSVQETVKNVPEIKDDYNGLIESYKQLKEQNAALLEALKTGFESIPQAVESGAARKIALLSNIVSTEE
ncbi:MAG: hypothetical protein IKC74_03325 [Clostridia bacterium]|nr:hypothetical protein [Clostridia bacterium]